MADQHVIPDIDAAEKRAETLRTLIRHENDVTNHRTSWLLVAQGILFAAAVNLLHKHWFPVLVLALIGIGLCVSIGHALANSYQSRRYLKAIWRNYLSERHLDWSQFAPLDGGNPEQQPVRWLFPWLFVPWLFGAAWLSLVAFTVWKAACTT